MCLESVYFNDDGVLLCIECNMVVVELRTHIQGPHVIQELHVGRICIACSISNDDNYYDEYTTLIDNNVYINKDGEAKGKEGVIIHHMTTYLQRQKSSCQ